MGQEDVHRRSTAQHNIPGNRYRNRQPVRVACWSPKEESLCSIVRFIPARLTDNPYLMADGQYEAMLRSLPEVERKRLLDGDWDVAEGAAFPEFSRVRHVVDPVELPTNWPRIRAADYGYSSPSCVLWGAIDWDNNIWVYRELYGKGMTGEQLASRIMEMEADDQPPHYTVLDSSCWNKTGLGPSIAETMIRCGVRWTPSDRNRLAGKMRFTVVCRMIRTPTNPV